MYPESIKNLIESFKLLPGIGSKSAERMAFHVLGMDEEKTTYLAESIKEAKEKIINCKVCNNYSEKEVCNICSDNNRDKDYLCVVEDRKSIFLFEQLGTYNGYYYVIKDLISPLNGVNPEDVGIDELVKRIEEEKFKEIIIAVKPSIEGETTTLYIKKILEGLNLKVSKIASGVPMGADIEYIDQLTLQRALNDRKEV